MGQYPITAGVFGKALAIPGTGNTNIIPESAWLFENQQQNPITGTNYTGSQIYLGAAGDVTVILAGVTGAQDTVTGLNLAPIFPANPSYSGFAAGTGYDTGTNIATTAVSLVHKSPAKQPTGLTVDITVPVPAAIAAPTTAGTGYSAGAVTSTATTGTGTGITGTVTIDGVDTVTGFTFTSGGTGYEVGDIVQLDQAASGNNATITLTEVTNGAVTAITIGNAAGTNYSVGDIITVNQGGSGLNCKFAIREVQSLLPTQAADAVTFKAVPVGTILPVAIDYVLVCPADSVALK